ncbi:restriction endonuclease subunit S [Gottfriedia acidiceleris]|uniref:restriction endonuclease subunit S n=1 Tax=Gottfriedia acidiceleris TaxID=371036 RepID=UPI000B42D77E|nr:restriction endonuclease subunit S [Gottfriedia acidiceleris]
MTVEHFRLGDIALISAGGTPNRSQKLYWENGDIPWVKISDMKNKYVTSTEEKITIEGLNNSSAKIIKKNTILFSIFATLGEVSILKIDASTNQAIAAIMVDENKVDINFLFYYLKSIKQSIMNSGRGVAQNNINLSILKNLIIPLPPLLEQKKIALILDEAQFLIAFQNESIDKMDKLVQSLFLEMFGNPVNNSRNLQKVKLETLGSLNRGKSKHRPRNAPELLNGPYPLIQTGDVAKSGLFIEHYTQTYSEIGLNQSKMWDEGTLCITIAANIAKSGILKFNSCFPDSIVGFIADESKTNNIYIHYWLTFWQKILEETAPESAQKNINLSILNNLEVMIPKVDKQNEFKEFVLEVEEQKKVMQLSLSQLEQNFHTLLNRAFKGELIVKEEVS